MVVCPGKELPILYSHQSENQNKVCHFR